MAAMGARAAARSHPHGRPTISYLAGHDCSTEITKSERSLHNRRAVIYSGSPANAVLVKPGAEAMPGWSLPTPDGGSRRWLPYCL